MTSNPIVCGTCGTENSPDEDFCTECGLPLTASGEQGLRQNEKAQDQGGVLGGDSAAPDGIAPSPTTDIGATIDDVPPRT